MKKQVSKTILFVFAVVMVAGMIGSSCKKDSSTTSVDKTKLGDSITAVKALLTNTVEGVAAGNYQKGSKATLQTTVDAVQTIFDGATSTQMDINNAIANLSQAIVLFKTKVIIPIAQESLIAQWTFSEGTGTQTKDASSNHLNGTLMAGHASIVGGGQLPTWTADRYGTANQALHFGKGGHIEVPYNTVLNPTEITITVWVKVDTIWPNNYIISQNWWTGYKFQLQEADKPFFTYQNNSSSFINRDWDVPGLVVNAWHHIAVTLKAGEEDYYADGVLVKSWTDVVGGIITISNPQAFTIGQMEPNHVTVAPADDPASGGVGFFKGSMDDIRMYNKFLTGTQIKQIYDLEKVQ